MVTPKRPFVPRNPRFRPPVPQSNDEHRINDRITAREVRLIGANSEQLGIVPLRSALNIALDADLDLVEVAPTANPPVCKVMDYGKFKYKEQKKVADSKKKRTENILKELRLRYNTDIGDLNVKLKHAREFLLEGDKVKFSMKFKGREVAHVDLGVEKFQKVIENLSDISTVDERSPNYGRQLYMVLAPQKDAALKKKAPEKTAVAQNQEGMKLQLKDLANIKV